MSAQTKEEFRKSLFAGKKLKRKKIKIRGVPVEIQQPTIRQILRQRDSENTEDQLVDMLVEYCFIPGTDQKAFESTDKGDILEWPVEAWFTDFNDAVSKLTEINVESAEKN